MGAATALAELEAFDLDDLHTLLAQLAVGELVLVVADDHARGDRVREKGSEPPAGLT
ncbi:hypothetical protein ACIBP6_10385 [Nonomuraea terrae]|uniref:hypothetical protein n=1 Tax=Nonomuraea terrae TaxID=2530383 RepID=UPI00379F1253